MYVSAANEGSVDDDVHSLYTVLSDLGYSQAESDILKPSVVSQITTLNVRRPKSGLPRTWIRKEERLDNADQRRDVLPSSYQYDEPSSKRKPTTSRSIRKERKLDGFERTAESTVDFAQSSGSSTSFSWSTKASAVQDATFTDSVDEREATKQDLPDLQNMDELVQFGDADDLSFLPTLPEFKALLVKESRFRMNIVGDWIAPLLRLENKWRYKLYEGFLHFLDVGLGEAVDRAVTALDSDDSDGYDEDDLED